MRKEMFTVEVALKDKLTVQVEKRDGVTIDGIIQDAMRVAASHIQNLTSSSFDYTISNSKLVDIEPVEDSMDEKKENDDEKVYAPTTAVKHAEQTTTAKPIDKQLELQLSVTKQIYQRVKDKRSLNLRIVKFENEQLHIDATIAYGTWRAAIQAAENEYGFCSIETERLVWTKKAIKEEMYRRVIAGESRKAADLKSQNKVLYRAIQKHYGGIVQLNDELGLERNVKRTVETWTKEAITKEILRMEKDGESRKAADIQSRNNSLYEAIRKVFGGIIKMNNELGLSQAVNSELKSNKDTWTKDSIKEEILRRVAAGESRKATDIQNSDYTLYTAIRKLYGGIVKMNDELGLSQNYVIPQKKNAVEEAVNSEAANIISTPAEEEAVEQKAKIEKLIINDSSSKATVKKAIKQREEQGLTLHQVVVKVDDPKLFKVAEKHFKSWMNAVKEAGSIVAYGKEVILIHIQDRIDKNKSIHQAAIQKDDVELFENIVGIYGSYESMSMDKRFKEIAHQKLA